MLLGLDLFPAETAQSVRALFVNFGGAEELGALRLLSEVRRAGIAAEIYPEAAKMKKQFDYAQKRDILYMVFVGENELAARTATVKNIVTGEQRSIPFEAVADSLR